MNKTEAEYALLLEARRRAGEIRWVKFEGVKLWLAGKTTYTPDFVLQLIDGSMQAHEVKGFWRDDARVKIKVAAEMFPWLRFVAVRRVKGAWVREEIPR